MSQGAGRQNAANRGRERPAWAAPRSNVVPGMQLRSGEVLEKCCIDLTELIATLILES